MGWLKSSAPGKAPAHSHKVSGAVAPRASACEECGSTFNLRVCTECGHVGCCESQKGHNKAHFEQSGHPIIQSMPLGSHFTWCYTCRQYLD